MTDVAGTVDAFLAAVSEAGYPPHSVESTYRTPDVFVVKWEDVDDHHELPVAVALRARELTGLLSAEPVAFRFEGAGSREITHWCEAWLWDNGVVFIRADACE